MVDSPVNSNLEGVEPTVPDTATAPTKNQQLLAWVGEVVALTEPAEVHWCDGSEEEYDRLCQQLVDAGTFTRLNEELRPNSYPARAVPADVALVEDGTLICAPHQVPAG